MTFYIFCFFILNIYTFLIYFTLKKMILEPYIQQTTLLLNSFDQRLDKLEHLLDKNVEKLTKIQQTTEIIEKGFFSSENIETAATVLCGVIAFAAYNYYLGGDGSDAPSALTVEAISKSTKSIIDTMYAANATLTKTITDVLYSLHADALARSVTETSANNDLLLTVMNLPQTGGGLGGVFP